MDWHWAGASFSTGFLPSSSSRSTTPNAYTSLLSVSLPEIGKKTKRKTFSWEFINMFTHKCEEQCLHFPDPSTTMNHQKFALNLPRHLQWASDFQSKFHIVKNKAVERRSLHANQAKFRHKWFFSKWNSYWYQPKCPRAAVHVQRGAQDNLI